MSCGRNDTATDKKLLLCAPACTQRCAGEGELFFAPTHHDPMLLNGSRDVKRQVLPVFRSSRPGKGASPVADTETAQGLGESSAGEPNHIWMKPCRHDFITQRPKLDVARQPDTNCSRRLTRFTASRHQLLGEPSTFNSQPALAIRERAGIFAARVTRRPAPSTA